MARKPKAAFVEEKPQKSALNKSGHEIPDSRPMAAALNIRRQPTLAEQIKSAVRSEALRREAEAAGMETFEEADDFDIGDDYDPSSPYENDFDNDPPPRPQAAPPEAEDPKTPAPVATPEPAPTVPQGGPVKG